MLVSWVKVAHFIYSQSFALQKLRVHSQTTVFNIYFAHCSTKILVFILKAVSYPFYFRLFEYTEAF